MPKKYHDFFQTTKDLLSWLFRDINNFSIVDLAVFIEVNCNINQIFAYFDTWIKSNQ